MGGGLRPRSAPDGGMLAVCPHCWEVNVGGERLCGRCGADMTMVLQESGGLRRTAPVQSPMPVRTAGRLGVGARAGLAVLTALLALAWLLGPLLGGASARARLHRLSGGVGEWGSGGNGFARSPTPPLSPSDVGRGVGEWGQQLRPLPRSPLSPSDVRRAAPSPGR